MLLKKTIALFILLTLITRTDGQSIERRIYAGTHFGLNFFSHLNSYRTLDNINSGIYGANVEYIIEINRLIASGGIRLTSNRFYYEDLPTMWNEYFYKEFRNYKSLNLSLDLEYTLLIIGKSNLDISTGTYFEPAFSYDITQYFLNSPPVIFKDITIDKRLGISQSFGISFRRKISNKMLISSGANIIMTVRQNHYTVRYPDFELLEDRMAGYVNLGIEYILSRE